jgi:hypothetical protein
VFFGLPQQLPSPPICTPNIESSLDRQTHTRSLSLAARIIADWVVILLSDVK